MLMSGGRREVSARPHAHLTGAGRLRLAVWLIAALSAAPLASAAGLEEAEGLFRTGRYDECAKLVAEDADDGGDVPAWSLLKARSELARGKYPEALQTLEEGLERHPSSLALRLLILDAYRYNGRDDDAAVALEETERLVLNAPRRFTYPEDRVWLGRFFLLRGADPRKVLDQVYDVATKQRPDDIEAHLAKAEMALDKQDGALAAQTLRAAPPAAAKDPRYHYLMALTFADGDRARSAEALEGALKINPSHADSLLLRADLLIDSERYDEAGKVLEGVLKINPSEPRAWAFRAVLAHLVADEAGEKEARAKAMAAWAKNPEVDHLIGRELAQKYRFAEGSACQRRALGLDPGYMPAKVQLCQDLLRLGEEEEGWKLADEIFAKDGYNVVAFNLVALRDHLKGFRTLREEGFVVRMDAREADLYGDRVLALLRQARKVLREKYGATVKEPVVVEIFPQKKDFAVRTFGLPGADGLLGVCFGRVITANSPASQGESPSSWESVLWHEYCHVVTLSKTLNKMPRWFSEGISVYEEEQRDPAWAAAPNPQFREMLLAGDLTPLSRLSSAFMAPETPLHLQFAYYESGLAVEFLVGRFGLPAVRGLLDDLGAGKSMNEALPGRAKLSLEQLDDEFAAFARKRGESIAPGATWEELDLPPDADSAALAAWLETRPGNFWGLRQLGARLVAEEKWADAVVALRRLKDLYPEYTGADNPYMLLAAAHRKLADAAAERAVLEELAARDAGATQAHLRLMELDEAARDWKGLARDARRLLAANPLIPAPHRQLALASERLGDRAEAISSSKALALIDSTDPAGAHYRLAKLLQEDGRAAEARREALKALEEAPRFLDAHRLLLELAERPPPGSRAPVPALSPPSPRR
jgi:tetratricopeptide (TPR) repeat protein